MKKFLMGAIALIMSVACVFACVACGNNDIKYTASDDQLGALNEVKAGTSDIAVIDSVMAGFYTSKDNFSSLQILDGADYKFEQEYYAIGFRKNGNTKDYVNYALYELQQEGKITAIANKYGLSGVICEISQKDYPGEPDANSDFGKIKAAGKMKLGYTIFEPIAYTPEGSTELQGFDIELAQAVCEKLGITLENVKINWDTKEDELNTNKIDCIWNGFTYTEERARNLDFSVYYMVNRQVMVIRKADATKYTSYESMKNARFMAESESAGEETIKEIIKAKIFG